MNGDVQIQMLADSLPGGERAKQGAVKSTRGFVIQNLDLMVSFQSAATVAILVGIP